MDARLLFPNKYLAAADLRDRDVTLTIDRIEPEDLHIVGTPNTERKWVLHFKEMQKRPEDERKRLVLNKTNALKIASLLGNETDDWDGRKVTLYPTTCKFGRDTVDCIRVRDKAPPSRDAAYDNNE